MEPDLATFDILLDNLDGPLPVQAVRANALNGMFYTELARKYPRWVEDLHHPRDHQPQSFSLAPIFENSRLLGFRVGTLTRETGQRVEEAWNDLCQNHLTIRLGPARVNVSQISRGKPWEATYEKIWETAPVKFGISLAFDTPLRIRSQGNYNLLPAPRSLWQWYARRWEAFSNITLPPEFLLWIERRVNVVEININTAYALMEADVEWKGIVGEVAYQALDRIYGNPTTDIPASRLPDYLKAFQALAMLSEYSGTGEKATMGMGRTRRMRTFTPYRSENSADECYPNV